MTEKLTPEEIKKALECCKPYNDEGCLKCPLANVFLPECAEILSKESVDLINRQQAEIERLKANNKAIMQTMADVHTEAIKEFAQKLKREGIVTDKFGKVVLIADINALVKEMVGEQE